MFEPKATASHLDSTLFEHRAMSGLSLLCAPERMSGNHPEFTAGGVLWNGLEVLGRKARCETFTSASGLVVTRGPTR
jgi:hypothetical protein